jgi:hypothetical protein
MPDALTRAAKSGRALPLPAPTVPTEPQGVTVPREWDRVDELLFDGRRIQAAHALREDFGHLTIHETIVALGERFEHLRLNHPESFNVGLDGYWDHFYS